MIFAVNKRFFGMAYYNDQMYGLGNRRSVIRELFAPALALAAGQEGIHGYSSAQADADAAARYEKYRKL